ncbi:uncharacterized protein LOC116924515 [Daphnia magna]|uniref:uncharacterized protein LOC116924515 n=1 Tax=Daphnia magna TaxID=35525 RepID=UPI001E1BA149|nr:uncharacterized protein LOC116924515 [Daphnia magna]
MSGSRPVNSNRQRNLSVTSNTSSSSYKDNSSVNYRTSDLAPDQRRTSRSSRTTSSTSNANGARDINRQFLSGANLPFRDFQRPIPLYDSRCVLNTPSDGEHREMQEKMCELQQKKWQYENAMSQLQQMHSPYSEEPTPNATRAEISSSAETVYTSISNRARKLQEAQQRLVQLQELMQNVSIDLDYNPYTQQNDDKNCKPKEFPLDFLRNVSSGGSARTSTIPRTNPSVTRHLNKESHQQQIGASAHLFSPQNNLSHDSLGSPKRYSTSSQVNGSLLDVFTQDEPSFDSSTEEVEDARIGGDEVTGQDDHPSQERMLSAETSTRNGIRLPISVPLERLDRIENQLERTNSLCELMVVEQRRLALVSESLLSAVSNLQFNNRNPTVQRNTTSSFSLSGLPVNSSWNDNGSDFHVLAQAVSTCCHLLTQLQRDLATVQLSLEPNPQHPETASRSVEVHQNPFRDTKTERSSAAAYECPGMDRFDPQVTLNNRVPPGTRTNNYWDNFRSYSRQNLLSSGPSNVNLGDHQQTGLSADMTSSSALPATSQQIQATSQPETSPRNTAQPPTRRTKRKINKGQRQVEIGVHCPPHADNRVLSALAYGLLSVRGQGGNSSGSSSGVTAPEVNARNLNHQQPSANEATSAPAISAMALPRSSVVLDASNACSNNNKVVKDTSTLKYSGARPKENRRAPEPNISSVLNVNLLAERDSEDKAQSNPGLETIVRMAMTEHAARPQFLSQLLQLLHKFDSDPLREMALNALHDCATDNNRPLHQSELIKVFNNVVGHNRELTPNLLEIFLNAVQLPEESDHEEGAASLHQQTSDDTLYVLRQALTPFLFRRLAEVHHLVVDTLSKLDISNNPNQSRDTNTAVTVGVSAASTSGQEDDLAEADQSCDQSCDGMAEASAAHDESEMNQRHSAVGLDEVPTRLMSALSPPVWSSARSANQQIVPAQQSDEALHHNNANMPSSRIENVSHWFPEDGTI